YRWNQQHTAMQRRSRYLNAVLTTMAFAKEIRLLDLVPVFRQRYRELHEAIRTSRLRLAARNAGATWLAQLVAVAAVSGSIYFISGRALVSAISIGSLVMYFGAF